MIRQLFAVAIAWSLAGCGPQANPHSAAKMSDAALNLELQRCRGLGLKSYDDPSCRAARQAQTDRFFGKPSGAAR